jgi:hypothetical protein
MTTFDSKLTILIEFGNEDNRVELEKDPPMDPTSKLVHYTLGHMPSNKRRGCHELQKQF